jgi:hypothetical protein
MSPPLAQCLLCLLSTVAPLTSNSGANGAKCALLLVFPESYIELKGSLAYEIWEIRVIHEGNVGDTFLEKSYSFELSKRKTYKDGRKFVEGLRLRMKCASSV